MDHLTYRNEKQRLSEYELIKVEQGKEENKLAYGELNTRFLDMEREYRDKDEFQKKMDSYQETKKNIEEMWHKNTSVKVKELKKNAKGGDNKTKDYYREFSLEQIELFIKNSDRGGNSKEYNDVATDLELYNRVSRLEDINESLTLLSRLKESCNTYLNNRRKKPRTTNGKIRRAIIEQISDKVNTMLDNKLNMIRTSAKNGMEAFSQEKTEETVNTACKTHYDMIYQNLQGNLELSKDEVAKLDSDMETILKSVKSQQVDDNQSNTMSSKFFNAIGWSEHKPTTVVYRDDEELKKSPLKKKVYHTINTLPGKKDAIEEAKQLLGLVKGKNRQFYSDGISGRGTYLAVSSNSKSAKDENTSDHCWTYGKNIGSVQLTMVLNENARIITHSDLDTMIEKKLADKYPKVYEFIRKSMTAARSRGGQEYFTMLAALFGYNTVKCVSGARNGEIDYYVTSDRKALTIAVNAQTRTGEENSYLDIDPIDLTDYKEETA